MKRSVDSALGVVHGIVGQFGAGGGFPAVEQLFTIIREFEQIEFDVLNRADCDGFLFQYGEVNWLPEPTFVVSFVRQLEIADADGEHEAYSQVRLEYRYRVDVDLAPIRDYSSWWFPETQEPFNDWLELVKNAPVWSVVRTKDPVAFEVSQELV